jgi:hypothetical protein
MSNNIMVWDCIFYTEDEEGNVTLYNNEPVWQKMAYKEARLPK